MPAARNEDVMTMVQKELKKNPDVETGTLFEKAREIDASIGDLSLRQFHARYPLQVKRKMSSGSRKKKKKKKKASRTRSGGSKGRGSGRRKATPASSSDGASREAVRDGLVRFARDVAAAEGKADLISVLTSVEDYVDDVFDALEKAGS